MTTTTHAACTCTAYTHIYGTPEEQAERLAQWRESHVRDWEAMHTLYRDREHQVRSRVLEIKARRRGLPRRH